LAKQLSTQKRPSTLTTLTSQHQVVHATFPASANTDLDIRHTLTPSDPEWVDYQVLKADRACCLYHDTSRTRKAWTKGVVYLRCNVASAVVDVLLSVRDPASYTAVWTT